MKRFITAALVMLFTTGVMDASAEITTTDIATSKYYAKSIGTITPMADGESFIKPDESYRSLIRYSFKDGQPIDTIFNIARARKAEGMPNLFSFSGYTMSPKGDKILIQVGRTKIYRRSFSADYYIYNIQNNTIEPLSKNGPQQAPKFSPDGNVIGFARQGNLFLVKLLFNNAESQVTKDGMPGKIQNGVPDWCYDEEFGITSAFEFSADSKLLAYVKFDESLEGQYTMPMYQAAVKDGDPTQPLLEGHDVYYPVAGSHYAKVNVHTFDIKSSVDRTLELPIDSDTYVPRIAFVEDDDNTLFLFTINRNQNRLNVYSANPRSTLCNLVMRLEDKYYLEPEEFLNIKFYGKRFIMPSERDGRNHLYLYSTNGQLVRQMTKGDWDVLSFYGWDEKSGTLYFSSNQEGPLYSDICKMDSKGKITRLSKNRGDNSAVFSKNLKYYIGTWSDINTPPVIASFDNQGKQIKVLEDNAELASDIKAAGFVKREFFTFKTVDGTQLDGWIIKPADASASKKYPVLMYQYGGPGSNEVLDSWSSGFVAGGAFESMLVQKGYIVACVDGRGCGRHGSEFKKETYLKLGVMESDDQVEAAKYLASLPYVDKDRIGIWGWSFGGYNTLMAMSQGTPVFRCGIAVAPVTDWRFYDATYTERFMRTPGENGDGYKASSALERVKNLNGRLLIVHGLVDDNVFYTNSAAYTDALIDAGIVFDQHVYTGKEHSLVGTNTRKHLYDTMIDFLERFLK